jgi:exodeoxyribonuclease-1
LEDLTRANGIAHEAAHDALSDVTATIAMAKLVKQKQPRLFDYVFNHRSKKAVAEMLNIQQRQPFFHISGMLAKEHMYGALMMPLAMHPTNTNAIICVDLAADPMALIDSDVDQIQTRVFSPKDQLPADTPRIPLKLVYLNKVPVVTSPSLVDEDAAKRLNIDVLRCQQHWQQLLKIDLQDKVQQVYTGQSFAKKPEAEQQLYDGFLSNQDKCILEEVRRASAEDLLQHDFYFADQRYNHLLFSYRARYFPGTLTADEQKTWQESCRWRLTDKQSGYLTLSQQRREIIELLGDNSLSCEKQAILEQLQQWASDIAKEFSLSS